MKHHPRGRRFSANGSTISRDGPLGMAARLVSASPNGTFTRALALTAQTLASSGGPKLRCLSFSQAIAMDSPSTPNGIEELRKTKIGKRHPSTFLSADFRSGSAFLFSRR